LRNTRRVLVSLLLTLAACGGPTLPGEKIEDASLVQMARDIVAMIGGYNCELLSGYLPLGADDFFRTTIPEALMDGMHDPTERVCFVLGVIQHYPRSETMDVRARTLTESRADLILLGGTKRAELQFLREGDRWKLDHEWALKQVQDLAVEQALRLFAIAEDGFYYSNGKRFTDSASELTERTHTVIQFVPGIASPDAPPMLVYGALSPTGRAVCGSSRSISGELFMIRQAADGSTSYTRGTSLPAGCAAQPLATSW
jgi:hypothetical protein